MTTKQIRQTLENTIDTLSFRNGTYTAKKSYFWGVAQDGSKLADSIQKHLPKAEILDYGNHYHGFVGGARPGSSKDSYFYCKFTVK